MPIRPELLLRNAAGIPIPPLDITERISRIDPLLGLRYLSAEWAIIWSWPLSDPRWATVQSGETDPAFAWDIVGYLPLTCSVEEAPAYLERTLRTYPREEVSRLCTKVADWNVSGVLAETTTAVIEATRDVMGKADEITSAIYAVTPAKKSNRRAKQADAA